MNITEAIQFLLLLVFALSTFISYLVIVNILTEKGNTRSNHQNHILNLLDFLDVIHSTTQQAERSYYKRLIVICISSFLLFLATAFAFVWL